MRYANTTAAKSLIDACEQGEIDTVRTVLKEDSSLINAHDTAGETLLMAAIRGQHREVIADLLAREQDFNTKNNLHETALIIAIYAKDKSTFRELLDKPAIDLRAQSGHYGTALTCAICLGLSEFAQQLIDKETNCSDKNHPGALHCAVENDSLQLVEKLISNGAAKDINTPKYEHYVTPEDWILRTMAYRNVPFPMDDANLTPLQIAVEYEEVEMAKLLVGCGADIDKIQDETCPYYWQQKVVAWRW